MLAKGASSSTSTTRPPSPRYSERRLAWTGSGCSRPLVDTAWQRAVICVVSDNTAAAGGRDIQMAACWESKRRASRVLQAAGFAARSWPAARSWGATIAMEPGLARRKRRQLFKEARVIVLGWLAMAVVSVVVACWSRLRISIFSGGIWRKKGTARVSAPTSRLT